MTIPFLKSLLIRSASLQREIEQEHARPRPDSLRLMKLKKLRLMIKDRLHRLPYSQAKPLRLAFTHAKR